MPGDVIVAVNGRPIASQLDVIGLVAQRRVGETLRLEILRNGRPLTVAVVLGSRYEIFTA